MSKCEFGLTNCTECDPSEENFQFALAEKMDVITEDLRELITELRRLQDDPKERLERYGGKGYRRQIGHAIVALEASILRLGSYVGDA